MYTLVLVRHGQSLWNLENRFAGWVDVDLSPHGYREARAAGALLRENGFTFDRAYTSYLRRACKSLEVILDTLGLLWIPETKTWRLNERHYGVLQGANRADILAHYGQVQFDLWRRSYRGLPPPLDAHSSDHPATDSRYALVPPSELPTSESLAGCSARVLSYWSAEVVPRVLSGSRILICAHGSTLRALLKHLLEISDQDIARWNVPTAIPLVLRLDANLKVLDHRYLGDPVEVQRQIELVASQGRRMVP